MGLFDIFKVNNEADIFGKYNLLSTAGKFDTGYKQDTKGLVKFVKKHYDISFKNYAILLWHPVTSEIKKLRPVEPYKGKGIKERGQYVLRKEGKKK